MNFKIKIVVPLITSISLGLMLLLFFPSSSFGLEAKVVFVDPKLRFLVINKGVHKDLAPGSHICLLNETGFIVTCAGIVLSNKSKAGLRFPIAEMKKLSVGSKVRLKTVYLKAEGPKNLKSASRFYQAKVSPANLPKTVVRDAVKAEKMLGLRELTPKSPPATAADTKNGAGANATAAGGVNGQPGSALGAGGQGGNGDGQDPAPEGENTDPLPGDPKSQDLEAGEEVAHQVGKPYPESLTNSNSTEPLPDKNGKDLSPEAKAKANEEEKVGDVEDQEEAGDKEEDKKKNEEETPAEPSGRPKSTVVDDVISLFTRDIPIKFFRYEAQSLRPIVSHIKYNHLDFDTISPETSDRWSLWRRNEPQKPTNGLGLQLKIFGRGNWVYNVGWRYWNYDSYRSVQRLDTSFPDLVADSRMTIDSYGVWGELGKRSSLIWKFGYYYGAGLDFDISEIKFQSMRRIDDGVERTDGLAAQEGIIAFARSNLNVLSLRASGSLEFSAFNVGTSINGVLLIPIYSPPATHEGSTAVPGNVKLGRSGEKDLQDSLGHDADKFGLELSLGLFFNI